MKNDKIDNISFNCTLIFCFIYIKHLSISHVCYCFTPSLEREEVSKITLHCYGVKYYTSLLRSAITIMVIALVDHWLFV